ncbi:two pore domain potassium channel family protein [Paracoccus sp. M683]|nr:two pore domain potassium channel family protein [Paracoccus sp. M683]
MMRFFHKREAWMVREPFDLKLIVAMIIASLWVLFIITASVTVWATAFRWLGLFSTIEESVYFSLTVFTTLGFGDVLLPQEWRILGVIAAVNGLINVGVLTAILIETLRHIGEGQRQRRNRR